LKKDDNTLLPPDGEFDALHHSQRLAPAVANFTECLLFLLSWPIALLRLIVEINFDAFSDCIGAQSLQLLIDVSFHKLPFLFQATDDYYHWYF
jgi:hypothetical protein